MNYNENQEMIKELEELRAYKKQVEHQKLIESYKKLNNEGYLYGIFEYDFKLSFYHFRKTLKNEEITSYQELKDRISFVLDAHEYLYGKKEED